MKFLDYVFEISTSYKKMMIPVFLNFISWYGLDALIEFTDKFYLHSGFLLTSVIWIFAVFLTELKNAINK